MQDLLCEYGLKKPAGGDGNPCLLFSTCCKQYIQHRGKDGIVILCGHVDVFFTMHISIIYKLY